MIESKAERERKNEEMKNKTQLPNPDLLLTSLPPLHNIYTPPGCASGKKKKSWKKKVIY